MYGYGGKVWVLGLQVYVIVIFIEFFYYYFPQ